MPAALSTNSPNSPKFTVRNTYSGRNASAASAFAATPISNSGSQLHAPTEGTPR